MAEVFISYSRTDRPVAEAIARELKALGVDVWWDHDLLGGDDYRRISEILERARVVIVIWSRLARQATQAWYLDFEGLLFYLIGHGIACMLVDIPIAVLARPEGGLGVAGSQWSTWAPYLFALMNGVIVAALYLRPALETRRMSLAVPIFVIAALLSIPAYVFVTLFMDLGERMMLAVIGPLTLALLMVTAIAQRASARR